MICMSFHYYIDKKFKAKITDIAKIKDDWYIIEITADTGEIYKISETIRWGKSLSSISNIGDIVDAEIAKLEDYDICSIDIFSNKIKRLLDFDGLGGFPFVELINDKWCDYIRKEHTYTPSELHKKFREKYK